jgi:hypothetical protein
MRRDKGANHIGFDNLGHLEGVFGRTQCCKIATRLFAPGTTGMTRQNFCNFSNLSADCEETLRFAPIS